MIPCIKVKTNVRIPFKKEDGVGTGAGLLVGNIIFKDSVKIFSKLLIQAKFNNADPKD